MSHIDVKSLFLGASLLGFMVLGYLAGHSEDIVNNCVKKHLRQIGEHHEEVRHDHIYPFTNDTVTEHVQMSRKEIIRAVCREFNITKMGIRMMVDNWRRVAYCEIPKAASSSWILALANINGLPGDPGTVHQPGDAEKFGYTIEHVMLNNTKKYNDFKTFVFTRNPFTRLVSAYRDKFTHVNKYTKTFQLRYGRHIIKKYRKNATKESLKEGNDVKFDEFVKYVISFSDYPERMDVHWKPQYLQCNPCKFAFDFIGKVETMEVDMKYVMRHFYKESVENIAHKNAMPPAKNISTYYKSLEANDLAALFSLYNLDFKLFGYEKEL